MFLSKALITIFVCASCLVARDIKPAVFAQYDNELVSDIHKLQIKEDFMLYAGSLDPYVMTLPSITVKKNGTRVELWSRGFIAEGYIWATAHSFVRGWAESADSWAKGDVVVLGETDIRGLEIDFITDIARGDILYCSTITRGILTMTVTDISPDGKYVDVVCNEAVRPGDSGSPVLNHKTDKVVGLISGLYKNYRGIKLQKVAFISPIKNKYNELLAQKRILEGQNNDRK